MIMVGYQVTLTSAGRTLEPSAFPEREIRVFVHPAGSWRVLQPDIHSSVFKSQPISSLNEGFSPSSPGPSRYFRHWPVS